MLDVINKNHGRLYVKKKVECYSKRNDIYVCTVC